MNISNHFMVVDDNGTNNLICEYTIRKFSEESDVNVFTEAEAALDYIKREYGKNRGNRFTVLFLDINMPFMTGWEFLEDFKNFSEEIHRQFIIYMLTSSVDERDKEKAEANPFVSGFYSKPLTINSIRQVYANHDLMSTNY